MLNHDWIGTEHILIGLIREEAGVAARHPLELILVVGSLALFRPRVHADDLDTGRRSGEGGSVMCLTCGCMLPHDDHGNSDYLTIEDLERSAKADNIGLNGAVANLVKT